MWRFAACRRLLAALPLLLFFAASARATNFNVNLSETKSTTDAVTALKNCNPARIIDTNLGSDSVMAKKGVTITETVAESDAVSNGKFLNVGIRESVHGPYTQQVATDNFQRANANPIGGNWANGGDADMQIVSNAAEGTSTGNTFSDSFWNAYSPGWPDDQYSEITVGNIADSAHYEFAGVRIDAPSKSGYYGQVQGPVPGTATLYIQKRVNSNYGNLTSTTATVNVGDKVRITAVGSTITLYLNGVQMLQATDNALLKGNAGMGTFLNSSVSSAVINGWAGGIFTGDVVGYCHPARIIDTNLTADSLVVAKNPRFVTESLTTIIATPTAIAAHVANPAETLSHSDSIGINKSIHISENELLITGDVCTGSSGGCKPVRIIDTNLTKDSLSGARFANVVAPVENLTTTDAVARQAVTGRGLTENLTTTANVGVSGTHAPGLNENLTTAATVTATKKVQPNITEILTPSDSVTGLISHVGNLTDNLFINDVLLVTKCGAIQEFLSTVDQVSAVHIVSKGLTETVSESDSLARSVAKTLSETNTVSDSINAQKPGSFSLNLSMTVGPAADSLTTSKTAVAQMAEARTTSDTSSARMDAKANMTDSSSTSDILSSSNVAANANLSETKFTSDQIAVSGPGSKTVTTVDSVTASSSVAAVGTHFSPLPESNTTSDALSASKQATAQMIESTATSALVAAGKVGQKNVSIIDNLSLSDTISRLAPLNIGISESAAGTDSANAFVTVGGKRRRFIITETP